MSPTPYHCTYCNQHTHPLRAEPGKLVPPNVGGGQSSGYYTPFSVSVSLDIINHSGKAHAETAIEDRRNPLPLLTSTSHSNARASETDAGAFAYPEYGDTATFERVADVLAGCAS